MANRSLEAWRRACMASLRERAAIKRTLPAMDPESGDAHEPCDAWVQMIKVEGELYDAYSEARATSDVAVPSWDELADAAAAG
jgi:hypothetical protein